MLNYTFVWQRGPASAQMIALFSNNGIEWCYDKMDLCAKLDGLHFVPVTYKHVSGDFYRVITEEQEMKGSITEEEKAFVNGLFLASTEGREPMTAKEASANLQAMYNDGVSFPWHLNGSKLAYLWNECITQQH